VSKPPKGWKTKRPPPPIATATLDYPRRDLWITARDERVELFVEDVEAEVVDITEHLTVEEAKRHARAVVGADVRWTESRS
jgi:hypothetical protein